MSVLQSNVLLADANAASSTAMIQILSALRIGEIFHATYLEQAKRALDETTFDLALVDPALGGEDGLELVTFIRRDLPQPANQLPIVATLNDARLSRVLAARDSGVDAVLAWPLSINDLRRRLQAVAEDPTPMVVADSFVGPDRRRRSLAAPGSVERRTAPPLLIRRARQVDAAPGRGQGRAAPRISRLLDLDAGAGMWLRTYSCFSGAA